MDTFEARAQMRDLANEALGELRSFLQGGTPANSARDRVSSLNKRAGAVLADAGYPGEAVWQSLRRALVGFDLPLDPPDRAYWQDVIEDLSGAAETLDSLLSPYRRDADIHIVG